MATPNKYDVFLSYHWSDHKLAAALADKLKAQNLSVFLDRSYVRPCSLWAQELERAIARCNAVVLCLGSREMESWQYRETYVALARKKTDSDFPVIPLLLPGSDPALGLLDLNPWIDLREGLDQSMPLTILAATIRRRPLARDFLERLEQTRKGLNPYKGLSYYREEDGSFYFGRDDLVKRLGDALQTCHFIAVTGVSGSGKSSLVRAGLIPKLRRELHEPWEILTVFPGETPLFNLTAAFMALLYADLNEEERLLKITEQQQALEKEPTRIIGWVKAYKKIQPGSGRFLLVVEQWEELYAFQQSEAENQTQDADAARKLVTVYIDALLIAAETEALSVVLTIRADFIGRALSYRPLADRLQNAQVCLGPMLREELRSAIEKPAEMTNSGFEDGLVDSLLNDIGVHNPSRLPLLSFVLHRLWEDPERRGGKMRLAAYGAMGGVVNALSNAADELYKSLGDQDKKTAQRIMSQLVRVGDGFDDIRRRLPISGLSAEASEVIKKLADKRLLLLTQDSEAGMGTAELAHEAVIRQWRLYKDWLYDDRQFATWRTQLEFARERREQLVKQRLGEARHWRKVRSHMLTKAERDFIDSNRRRDFFQKASIAVMILLPLSLIAAFSTWVGTENLLTPKLAMKVLLVKAGVSFFLEPDMVQIPPEDEAEELGRLSFMMGSTSADKDADIIEFPQHRVTIGKPFNLGRYGITIDEYLVFAYLIEREGGCPDKHKVETSSVLDENWGRGRRPAINISWRDAQCYAQWLSEKTGADKPYRLPTEAEWEFAARAGTQTRFWWGSDIPQQTAVCDGCMSDWQGKSEKKKTAEVNDPAFEPNGWGLYHISGNTWEWVQDCWHENYNSAPVDGSAWESQNGGNCGRRVLRGGSWVDTPVGLRSTHRYKLNTDYRYYNVGFRLAQD